MLTGMEKMFSEITILTTVNAPFSNVLDAGQLAACLMDVTAAKLNPGHVSAFFGEVPMGDQVAFAKAKGIPLTLMTKVAKAFSAYSGETYPIAA
jgi:hypothetical protein